MVSLGFACASACVRRARVSCGNLQRAAPSDDSGLLVADVYKK